MPLKDSIQELTHLLDLPFPPPKFIDLWRIEGEGPDLHLHQAVFYFPLIHVRDLVSRVSVLRIPSYSLWLLVLTVCDRSRGVFESP